MGQTRFWNVGAHGAARLCRTVPRGGCSLGRGRLPDSQDRRESPLPEAAELAAKLLDVLRVLADRFLEWLQPLQHPSVVALVAVANSFLLGELLPGVGKQLLLVLKLRLENPAAVLVARRGRIRYG